MSDLAFNLNGDPFEVPAHAAGWRVRRMKNKGAPEVVYGRSGQPLVLPIEADLDDVRAEVPAPGRYRLDPVDETNRPIANAPVGYVYVHELALAPTPANSSIDTPSNHIVIEAMRMNSEIARSVVERFPQMLEAAATLLRAADGAGLPARQPRVIDRDRDEEDEDQEEEVFDEADTQAGGFDLNALLKTFGPLIGALANGNVKIPGLAGILDWRKAAPSAKPVKPAREVRVREDNVQESTPVPAVEAVESASSTPIDTGVLPPIDPATMAHFIAIQSALNPKEAELARAVAADFSPTELRAWFDELKKLSVPQAVQTIRRLVAGDAEAVS